MWILKNEKAEKTLKKMLIFFGVLLLLMILFLNLKPEFRGSFCEVRCELYAKSKSYKEGVFINIGDVKMSMSFNDTMKSFAILI